MTTPLHDSVRAALSAMRLREMDLALLSFAIVGLADELGVGNPRFHDAAHPDGASEPERHCAYRQHVADVIVDPAVFLVKFIDFVDNAASLAFMPDENGRARRARRARKYAPLTEIRRRALEVHADGLPINAAGLEHIRKHLATIETRLADLVR